MYIVKHGWLEAESSGGSKTKDKAWRVRIFVSSLIILAVLKAPSWKFHFSGRIRSDALQFSLYIYRISYVHAQTILDFYIVLIG